MSSSLKIPGTNADICNFQTNDTPDGLGAIAPAGCSSHNNSLPCRETNTSLPVPTPLPSPDRERTPPFTISPEEKLCLAEELGGYLLDLVYVNAIDPKRTDRAFVSSFSLADFLTKELVELLKLPGDIRAKLQNLQINMADSKSLTLVFQLALLIKNRSTNSSSPQKHKPSTTLAKLLERFESYLHPTDVAKFFAKKSWNF
jgi:hypothetical protein